MDNQSQARLSGWPLCSTTIVVAPLFKTENEDRYVLPNTRND
jgi:hypothetical protein